MRLSGLVPCPLLVDDLIHFLFHSGFLQGFDVGIATMRKGEISKFIFSPKYGYREMGCPPRIPPNTSGKHCKPANMMMMLQHFSFLYIYIFLVLFEIELVSFVDQAAADEFSDFPKV
jgi:FK506-binding protein 6